MDRKQLEKTASLARLNLSEKEKSEFTEQLRVVFDYFSQISSVDTQHTEPLVYPLDGMEEKISLRLDQIQPVEDKENFLSLAPERLGNEYKVPPVVE